MRPVPQDEASPFHASAHAVPLFRLPLRLLSLWRTPMHPSGPGSNVHPLMPFLTKCCSQITSLGFRPGLFLPLLYQPQCFFSCSLKCDFFLKHRIRVSALGKLRLGPCYLKQSLSIFIQHQSHPEISLKHRELGPPPGF